VHDLCQCHPRVFQTYAAPDSLKSKTFFKLAFPFGAFQRRF
jgi:hypothetical protein